MRTLALLLLCGCAASGSFPVHERTGIGVRGLAAESLQSDRDDPAVPGGGAVDLDASGFGIQAESFLQADTSATFTLLRRVYDSPGVEVRALEYRSGLRYYLFETSPVQPFVTGVITVAGLDSSAEDGLSYGIGAGVGGGLATWIGRHFGLEAGFLYEGQVVDFHLHDTDEGTEVSTTESIYGLTLEIQAGIFF
ncbi:MAG: hypothetical protein EYC70_14775 [Planctomycetota bacterium]|nr:MAG: hypothetical protein EYC70_14775 [Planctomycetota bacterium]